MMNKKIGLSNEGVSEMVGTILLLGIAVVIFSILYVYVLSAPTPSSSSHTNLIAYVQDNNVTIEHKGGESLGLDTKIIITIDSTRNTTTIKGYLKDVNGDGLWNIGERVICNPGISINGLQVEVTVIDVKSKSIILSGIIQESG